MSEPDSFPLTLGDRTWNLPHQTFGVVKRLQPKVTRVNSALFVAGVENAPLQLDEKAFDALIDVAIEAIHLVDPEPTRESIEAMVFSSSDLIAAQRSIMLALGMVTANANEGEGASDPKA